MTRILSEEEKLQWLQLTRTESIGPISFFHLIKRFGSAQSVIERLPEIMRRNAKLGNATIASLEDARREYDAHRKRGIHLIAHPEPLYPAALRSLPDAPPLISVLGRADLLGKNCFGIVGARNASLAGKKMAEQLAEELGKSGMIIVSGLARGIDSAAHRVALRMGTVAVLAGGVDTIYPPENKDLYQAISEQGVLISEVPLGQQAKTSSFPRRNRLISGLSWGIVVVEAGLRSGSLLTARFALEQDRTVFAVPGHPLDARAQGVNTLIKQGACLVQCVTDILEEVPAQPVLSLAEEADPYDDQRVDASDISRACAEIEQLVSNTPVPIGAILHDMGIPLPVFHAALVELEVAGIIVRDITGCVFRVPE